MFQSNSFTYQLYTEDNLAFQTSIKRKRSEMSQNYTNYMNNPFKQTTQVSNAFQQRANSSDIYKNIYNGSLFNKQKVNRLLLLLDGKYIRECNKFIIKDQNKKMMSNLQIDTCHLADELNILKNYTYDYILSLDEELELYKIITRKYTFEGVNVAVLFIYIYIYLYLYRMNIQLMVKH